MAYNKAKEEYKWKQWKEKEETAFGKTVVCSYLIAERKVNTLILLQSKDLLNQWVDELNKFLDIREEPPEYETQKIT